jgi:hypothetical protein
MKAMFVLAAGAVLLGGATAARAEYPTFEINGFPFTQHQLNGVPTGQVRESMPATATLAGMPVSPHQVAVLTPRPRMTQQDIAAQLLKAGYSRVRFVVPAEYTVLGLRNGRWTKFTVNGRTGDLR